MDRTLGVFLLVAGVVITWFGFADEAQNPRRRIGLSITVVAIGAALGALGGWLTGVFA